MSTWRNRGSRAGMSILEMMVSITILLSMTMVVYMTLSESIEFNSLLGKRDSTTRSARAVLQKLRRELQVAYLTPARNSPDTIQTVFVGMDDEPDKLYFSTLAHQRLYRNSREADQAEITVWAESSPRDKGEGYILYHRESERVDEEPGEGGRVHPLAYNVRSFNVRYLDPQTNEWRDEWDTRGTDTPYRLPRAMEIGLVLIAEDPDDEDRTIDVPFLSRFMLAYGQVLKQDFLGLAAVTGGVTQQAGIPAADQAGAAPSANRNPLPPLGGNPAGFAMTQGNGASINSKKNSRPAAGNAGTPSRPTAPTRNVGGGGK